MAPIILTFLWGWPGKDFGPSLLTNWLARPDVQLKVGGFVHGAQNKSPTLHEKDRHGIFNVDRGTLAEDVQFNVHQRDGTHIDETPG